MEHRDLKQELRDKIKEMIQTETAEYMQTQQVRAMDAEMVNKAVDERIQQRQNMAQPWQAVAKRQPYETEEGVQTLVEKSLDKQTS